ncbi:truncated hemoglobin [Aliikangiella sp. G2MR2-5]|uniref:truncated hemoglobin n=1 Tax=Aliikangiella sp. G2MR2-5 TaxID=2788943 RepID=UPI0018AB9843|nr:group 1 truncated hemoglobin [Aliikangiella sp. G2MR2-5]
MNDHTIFNRIGGKPTVEAAVNRFYDKFLLDPEIAEFFTGIPLDAQKIKLRRFFTFVLGGESEISMARLSEIHAPLLERGLNQNHVDKWLTMMLNTLEELSIPKEIIEIIREELQPFAKEIVPD